MSELSRLRANLIKYLKGINDRLVRFNEETLKFKDDINWTLSTLNYVNGMIRDEL